MNDDGPLCPYAVLVEVSETENGKNSYAVALVGVVK